jgi:hypothetical protein
VARPGLRAPIFDCDGGLADSEPMHAAAPLLPNALSWFSTATTVRRNNSREPQR